MTKIDTTESEFLPLLRRFNPADGLWLIFLI
jgi:hypothetical protein